MKLRLTRSNKIEGKAGEIVEVSPARAAFLLRYHMAEPVTVREQAETPEKAVVKSTRTAKEEEAKAESVKKEAKTAKAAGRKK